MGFDDLLHNGQAKAMILMLLQGCVGTQAVQYSVRKPFAIITDGDLILLLYNAGINAMVQPLGLWRMLLPIRFSNTRCNKSSSATI